MCWDCPVRIRIAGFVHVPLYQRGPRPTLVQLFQASDVNKIRTMLVMAVAAVWVASPVRAQPVSSATGYVGSEPIRTVRLCSDFHTEASQLLKSIESAGARIAKMADEARASDLVVLRETLEENNAAAEALAAMGQAHIAQLAQDVPSSESIPTETERLRGERALRQLTVLKDRVTDLYVDSAAFKKRLSQETKQNQVTRISD